MSIWAEARYVCQDCSSYAPLFIRGFLLFAVILFVKRLPIPRSIRVLLSLPIAVCFLALLSFFLSSMEAVLVGNAKICASDQVKWLKPAIGIFIAAKIFSVAMNFGKKVETTKIKQTK